MGLVCATAVAMTQATLVKSVKRILENENNRSSFSFRGLKGGEAAREEIRSRKELYKYTSSMNAQALNVRRL